MSDPWSEIPSSSHPGIDNVRRVEMRYPLDFRRGKDFHGRYIFILEGKTDKAAFPSLQNSEASTYRRFLTVRETASLF